MDFKQLFKRDIVDNEIRVIDANANNFKGQWLAIVDEKIVAHNEDMGKVMHQANKHYKNKTPRFVRIPKANIAMY